MIKTNIQWCTYTHNFWSGCHKVSAGCKFCYMHRILDGKSINPNIVIKSNTFTDPLYEFKPQLIFTCSMSDFFIEEADQWREEAWDVIRKTPQHTWLILTKRPERIEACLPHDWGTGYPNVWLGVTVENNDSLFRLSLLAKIPAKLRFVSAEPLLETVDFTMLINNERPIDAFQWIILGGESGNNYGKYRYRECREKWIYDTLYPLKELDKYIFVKQVGTYVAINDPKQKEKQNNHGSIRKFWNRLIQIQQTPPWRDAETNGMSKAKWREYNVVKTGQFELEL
jgi:protein gp37